MSSTSTSNVLRKNTVTSATMVQRAGVRMTRQRRAVAEVLLASQDHPTAAQIFKRAKNSEPGISLATVYNCLETMAEAGLINQLRFRNAPSRYCPNVVPHVHLINETSQEVIDIHLKPGIKPEDFFNLPDGICITSMEACLHGYFPEHCTFTNKK